MRLAVGLSHRLESTTAHSAGVIAPTGVRGAGSRAIRGSPGAAGWREGDCRSAPPVSVVPESSFIQRGSLPLQGATRKAVKGVVT